MIHPLRLERIKRGLSQYDVAVNSGVPVGKISYEERGYHSLTPKQKKRVANALKMKVSELFSRTDGGGR